MPENKGIVRRTFLPINTTFTLTDDGSTGHGSKLLFTFPAGNIHILGAVADVAYTVGTSTLTANSSVGSTATSDSTLSTTEVNIVPSTASNTTSGSGTFKGVSTGAVTLDGTSSVAKAYLNFGTSTDPSGNKTITVKGRVLITWTNLGDK